MWSPAVQQQQQQRGARMVMRDRTATTTTNARGIRPPSLLLLLVMSVAAAAASTAVRWQSQWYVPRHGMAIGGGDQVERPLDNEIGEDYAKPPPPPQPAFVDSDYATAIYS